jgi:Na+-translocating ferredoxin:NAD+ oxidoreductase RnfG subunit
MKLTKREQVLLLGALMIAVAVMFVNYVYFPIQKDIKELSNQSKQLMIQIDEAKQKQELVKILEGQLAELQAENDKIYEDVMKTWDEPEILVYIEETLDESGVSELIDNYGVITGAGYLKGDINLKISATYENLLIILKKLEEGKYFTTVESMDIKDKENSVKTADDKDDKAKNAEGKQLDINLVLRFYALDYLKQYSEDYPFMKGKYSKTKIFE